MKNLIQFCAVLLLATSSFAGDFIVGATDKGVDTIYVKPIGAADGCHIVTGAEVSVMERVIPKVMPRKKRVCAEPTTETLERVVDGKVEEVVVTLPGACQYCVVATDGATSNCSRTNTVIVKGPADTIVFRNSVNLSIEPAEGLMCAGITSKYIALKVTPGQSMTITMPDEVKLIDMKQTLTEDDSTLENVIYKTLE